ncbi:Glycine cleavage system transcriptional activator [Roseobacter fucihabitans]|uniref:Glycine cleavage system transcriptional activator n=1 Tax=Roseobacter fucihabitans TaxID=1537242 RepID=A0ABZ2BY89_9RHOB|nr:LysR substrate-binding domain-containing protein [Roseobacter litoralis]MBC6965042.1 Glycine cleavage system transcriptional activator [Roseobacter litoralis]
MTVPRRYLPSISALVAFEAVARLGSATLAARELSLTQSAISRQLKALEDQIGVTLLLRQGRGFALTPKGHDYLRDVRNVLQRLGQATISAQSDTESGMLNLAILPAFGMHWLAPRLRDFARRHPEVTVNLSTRLAPFDFHATSFDAAIHFGRRDWPKVSYLPLLPETVVPVCAPALIATPLSDPHDILQYDLLHLDTRPQGWVRWMRALGLEANLPPGMVFDQFSTMAQAAIHGLGIALLPTFVAEPYLSSGQLALASQRTSESIGSYYLVWPKDRQDAKALTSFRDWLAGAPDSPADRPDPSGRD